MRIITIEPTPSPNVMKLNMDKTLPSGTSYNVTKDKLSPSDPSHIRALLAIEGIKSLFQVSDFISIERYPKANWEDVLSRAREVLGDAKQLTKDTPTEKETTTDFSKVQVWIQTWRGIPLQVKLEKDGQELRCALPDSFQQAVLRAQQGASNVIIERKWIEQNARYGEMEEVGQQVVEEIKAAYSQERLHQLVSSILAPENTQLKNLSPEEVLEAFKHPSWQHRFAALDQFEPTLDTLHVLKRALNDPHATVRRLAVVYLSYLEGDTILQLLIQAMKDSSPIVRRTAGDCLSDIGDPKATAVMCDALRDKNKLVRWRAARFLFEVGNDSAIVALREATDEPEFEVKMQIKMALERIERGEAASGTIWQQMTQRGNDSPPIP